jgi:hypothetical protein
MVDAKAWLSRGFSHLLRIAVTAAPILASPLRSHIAGTNSQSIPLLWPPVGGMTIYAVPLGSMVIGLVGWGFPKRLRKRTAARLRFAGLVVAFASLFAFSYLLLRFVKDVPTPDNGIQYRSIGFVRTVAAQRVLPSTMSDQDVLKAVGLDDGSIESAWTPSSVVRVRLMLLMTYILCLSSINFVVGISSMLGEVPSRENPLHLATKGANSLNDQP